MSTKLTTANKKWLRDAKMQKLSMFVKNKTELIGNAAQLGIGATELDELDRSGLSALECKYVCAWVDGIVSGRQCLSAILNLRASENVDGNGSPTSGFIPTDMANDTNNFDVIELISNSLDLPNDFLCDSGYIYKHIFSRPPTTVIREALQLLSQKAYEKSPSYLGIDQINLAIKQLRLDNLSSLNEENGCDDDDDEAELDLSGKKEKLNRKPKYSSIPSLEIKGNDQDRNFRLQVLIELIRMHIKKHCEKRAIGTSSYDFRRSNSNSFSIDLMDQISDTSTESSNKMEVNKMRTPSSNSSASVIDLDLSAPVNEIKIVIEKHLNTPIPDIVKSTENMTSEELENLNSLLKPYLKQLSALKTMLGMKLKDLQDSRAFIALGLNPNATDAMIKKAYHSLAVKLHPDKPGGDTIKFQQLKDSYEEIMKKRKSMAIEKEALNEIFTGKKRKGNAGNGAKESNVATKEEGMRSSNDEVDVDDENNENHQPFMNGEEVKVDDENESSSKSDALSNSEDNNDEVPLDEDCTKDELGSNADLFEKIKKKSKGKSEADNDNDADAVDRNDEDIDDPVEDEDKPTLSSFNPFLSSKRADSKIPNGRSFTSDSEHVQFIIGEINKYLELIKECASQCTNIAQLNIKWYKKVEKACKMRYPVAITEILKLIVVEENDSNQQEVYVSFVEDCSLHHAIRPVENICEYIQLISSYAMEVTNSCGEHYAKSAANSKSFLKSVENSMNFSLNALKTVISLITAHDQLSSCLNRVSESSSLALENEEINDLLLEMVKTAIRSNMMTINNTVDRVVDAALAAKEVYDGINGLMKETEYIIYMDIKKKAAEFENDDLEDEYCEEDKEALRQSRKERQEEFLNKQQQQQQPAAGTDENGANEDSSIAADKNDNPKNSLNDLRSKIRTLQIQLKIQHISALQSMNKEVVNLQSQILKELKGLPYITSFNDLFDESKVAIFMNKYNNKTNKGKEEFRDSGNDSRSENDLHQHKLDFRTSLFSLVADYIDNSCNNMRQELLSNKSYDATVINDQHMIDYEINEEVLDDKRSRRSSGSSSVSMQLKINAKKSLLDRHFGWLRIVLFDGTRDILLSLENNIICDFDNESKVSSSNPNCSPPASGTASGTRELGTKDVQRIALLPDYRSKAIFLCSIVDMSSLNEIIELELRERLSEIFGCNNITSAAEGSSQYYGNYDNHGRSSGEENLAHSKNEILSFSQKPVDSDSIGDDKDVEEDEGISSVDIGMIDIDILTDDNDDLD
eukprot:gene13069-17518_t